MDLGAEALPPDSPTPASLPSPTSPAAGPSQLWILRAWFLDVAHVPEVVIGMKVNQPGGGVLI